MSFHGYLKTAKTTHNSFSVVKRRLKIARLRLDFQVHPSFKIKRWSSKRTCDIILRLHNLKQKNSIFETEIWKGTFTY